MPSNAVVTFPTAQSTTMYRLHDAMENRARTISTGVQHGTIAGTEGTQTQKWKVPLHRENAPK